LPLKELTDIVKNYNETTLSPTKMNPVDVNKKNEKKNVVYSI